MNAFAEQMPQGIEAERRRASDELQDRMDALSDRKYALGRINQQKINRAETTAALQELIADYQRLGRDATAAKRALKGSDLSPEDQAKELLLLENMQVAARELAKGQKKRLRSLGGAEVREADSPAASAEVEEEGLPGPMVSEGPLEDTPENEKLREQLRIQALDEELDQLEEQREGLSGGLLQAVNQEIEKKTAEVERLRYQANFETRQREWLGEFYGAENIRVRLNGRKDPHRWNVLLMEKWVEDTGSTKNILIARNDDSGVLMRVSLNDLRFAKAEEEHAQNGPENIMDAEAALGLTDEALKDPLTEEERPTEEGEEAPELSVSPMERDWLREDERIPAIQGYLKIGDKGMENILKILRALEVTDENDSRQQVRMIRVLGSLPMGISNAIEGRTWDSIAREIGGKAKEKPGFWVKTWRGMFGEPEDTLVNELRRLAEIDADALIAEVEKGKNESLNVPSRRGRDVIGRAMRDLGTSRGLHF